MIIYAQGMKPFAFGRKDSPVFSFGLAQGGLMIKIYMSSCVKGILPYLALMI